MSINCNGTCEFCVCGLKFEKMSKINIQSQINVCEARIKQYQNSDLHSDQEKQKLIDQENILLEKLQLELAKEIDVNSFEKL